MCNNIDLIKFPLKISSYVIDLGEKFGNYYLYNTLYNILLKLNNEQYAYFKNLVNKRRINRSDFSNYKNLMWILYKYGFLITYEIKEFDIFMDILNKVKYRDDILITAIVILGCNMDCTYCFEKWHGEKELRKKIYIDAEFSNRYLKFVENFISSHEIKQLKVAWFGGEPLLDIKMVIRMSEDLLLLSKKYSIELINYIVTNGTLLHLIPPDKFRLFNFVQVTLDGIKEIHDRYRIFPTGRGSFDVIYKNIRKIPEDFEIVLRINVAERDIEAYKKLLDLFKYRHKHTTVDFSPIFTSNNAKQHSSSPIENMTLEEYFYIEQELINYAVDNGFKISTTLFPHWTNSTCWRILPYAFHITTEGEAYACVTQLGNRNDYYGFLSGNGEFIISDWTVYARNKIKSYSHIDKECKSCPFAPICALSCVHKNGCTIFKNKQILLERLLLLEKTANKI